MSLNLDRSTWTSLMFGQVVESVSDRVNDPSQAGVERYVGLEHLDPGSMTVTRWGTPDQVEAQKLRFRPGDVIFGRRRAYQKKVARADFDGICSAHALVLRAKPGRMDPDFLPVFLSSDLFLDRAVKISVGSLSPTVNWKTLAVQEFELPPLNEQKRIAELLWSAEQHRGNLQALQSAFHDLVDNWISEVIHAAGGNAGWITIGQLVDRGAVSILTGPFGTALKASEYVRGCRPVIHPSNIRHGVLRADEDVTVTEEKAAELIRWQVEEGDLIMMRKRDVNRSALATALEVGWIFGSDCMCVRVHDRPALSPEFLQLALRSRDARAELLRRAPGTAMPGINEKSIRALSLPECSLEEQARLTGRYLELVEHSGALARERTALADMRRALLSCLPGRQVVVP